MGDLEDRLRRLGGSIVDAGDDAPRPSVRPLREQAAAVRGRRQRSVALGVASVVAVVASGVALAGPTREPRRQVALLIGLSEPTPSTVPNPSHTAASTTTLRPATKPRAVAPTTPPAPATTSAPAPSPTTSAVAPTTTTVTTRPPECDPSTFRSRPPMHFAGAGGSVWAAFANEILATSADGGRTWTQQCFHEQGLQFHRLAALSPSRVLAIAETRRPGANDASWVVVQSDDGGHSWSDVRGVSPGLYDDVAGITFTGDTGWLYGATRKTAGDPLEPALWRSRDAGRHWERVPLPMGATSIPSVSFVDDVTGWLVNDDSELFRTDDGGDTWTEVALPEGIGSVRSVAATKGHVHVATTSRTAPAGDGTESLLSTSDGGTTWTRTEASVMAVAAVDDLVAVAVGDGLLRTNDGGLTWRTPDRPPPLSGFETVTHDGRILWATSPGGAFTSRDGGASWTAADVPLK